MKQNTTDIVLKEPLIEKMVRNEPTNKPVIKYLWTTECEPQPTYFERFFKLFTK